MKSYLFKSMRQVLDRMESIHNLVLTHLNGSDFINKQIMLKITYYEEQLRTYSPITIILFSFLFYYVVKYLMKVTRRTLRKINSIEKLKVLAIKIYMKTPGGISKFEKMKAESKEMFKSYLKLNRFKKIEFRDNKQEESKVLEQLEKMNKVDEEEITCGKLTGSIYCADSRVQYIASEALRIYAYSNMLHGDLFTGARFIESQLIKIGVDLFNGKEDACGITTNGGTLSILAAMYSYRTRGQRLKNIKKPEIIVPVSAHAAFFKACDMFRIKCIKIPLDPVTYQVNVNKVKNAITKNTICIVGSSPNFPHSIADNIEALNDLAVRYNVPLHVDCCLGGFLIAFFQKANIKVHKFDFTLPGVTSISADLHKYGLCPKGISLLLFASHEDRKYTYFCYPHFMGGLYATPSFDGSRTGGLIAASYAILTSLGKNVYVNIAKKINEAIIKVKKASANFDMLTMIGDPYICGFAFTGERSVNVYDQMSHKGWHLNLIANPKGFSFIFTSANMNQVDQLIADLQECNDYVRDHPEVKLSNISRMYGMVAPIPDEIAKNSLDVYLDSLLD